MTAALMTALLQSPDLASSMMGFLLNKDGKAATGKVIVTPQKSVIPAKPERACFIDLELSVPGKACVWIEAKLHSPLSGEDQFWRYASTLAKRTEDQKLLVVLAPSHRRDEFTRKQLREGKAVFASWSEVHGLLSTWCRNVANRDSRRKWFIQEVMAYMDANGQGSPGRLRKIDVDALKRIDTARANVDALFADVVTLLEKRNWKAMEKWAPGDGQREQSFKPPPSSLPKLKSRRKLKSLAFTLESPPLWFGAGGYLASIAQRDRPHIKVFCEAKNDSDKEGRWEPYLDDSVPWVWRRHRIEALLTTSDAAEPANALAEFASDAFNDITKLVDGLP
jgi:hypothetical protein